jgi:hypothetical protein
MFFDVVKIGTVFFVPPLVVTSEVLGVMVVFACCAAAVATTSKARVMTMDGTRFRFMMLLCEICEFRV